MIPIAIGNELFFVDLLGHSMECLFLFENPKDSDVYSLSIIPNGTPLSGSNVFFVNYL